MTTPFCLPLLKKWQNAMGAFIGDPRATPVDFTAIETLTIQRGDSVSTLKFHVPDDVKPLAESWESPSGDVFLSITTDKAMPRSQGKCPYRLDRLSDGNYRVFAGMSVVCDVPHSLLLQSNFPEIIAKIDDARKGRS